MRMDNFRLRSQKYLSESVLKFTLSSFAGLERRFFWIRKVQEIFSLWARRSRSIWNFHILSLSLFQLWAIEVGASSLVVVFRSSAKNLAKSFRAYACAHFMCAAAMTKDWTSETAVATNWTGGLSRLLLGWIFGMASWCGSCSGYWFHMKITRITMTWCFHTKKARFLL